MSVCDDDDDDDDDDGDDVTAEHHAAEYKHGSPRGDGTSCHRAAPVAESTTKTRSHGGTSSPACQ